MANVVPWLVTMSLFGLHDFATPASPHGQITQKVELPMLNLQTITPVTSLLDVTTPHGSFDDPAFDQEEPPTHVDCDIQNTYLNSGKMKTFQGTPHGFKIVEPGSEGMITTKDKKNERQSENINTNDIGEKIAPTTTKNFMRDDLDNEAARNQSDKIFNPNHTYRPPKDDSFKDEYAGPALKMAYYWKVVDFEFAREEDRNNLIYSGTFIPENTLPLGIEVWKERIFVSLPRWKKGIPATLAYFYRNSTEKSPRLRPYPNWSWHHLGDCHSLTSVFRMNVDDCGRLWVMDSGKIDVTTSPKQICPPTIFVFDLQTDTLIRAYQLPKDQAKEESLYTNIIVDTRQGQCESAIAYASDVFRYGLVVYDYLNNTSFRISHHFFYPDPLTSKYNLHGLEFHWTDGIFGLALTPLDVADEKTLFFHPMSSFREFAVPTSAIRTKRLADANIGKFIPVGKPRAKDYGHSSGSAIDKDGIMFFNMVTRDAVWCWDTRKEFVPKNLAVVGSSNVSLVFPNDIRVDHDLLDPNIWVLSNRLPMYLYGYLNLDDVNFRILRGSARDAVKNTVCDPTYIVTDFERDLDTC